MPLSVALSPNGRYLATLNAGYGSVESDNKQSISILDLQTNQVRDFPDDRLAVKSRQTYFLGLAFSSDGSRLFASMSSIRDPGGEKEGSTGDGIASYSFANGAITPERFLKMPMLRIQPGQVAAPANLNIPEGEQISYPAGIAMVKNSSGDQILVANNLSDDAALIDAGSGKVINRFNLSTSKVVPSSFPYTAVADREGKKGYVSLWNASRIAQLDLSDGKVVRMIPLHPPKLLGSAGSHPSAMAFSRDERRLFVALANRDEIAIVNTLTAAVSYLRVRLPGQIYGGVYPNALAVNDSGTRLYVALGMANAVAVVDIARKAKVMGFLPTGWYPAALASHDGELFVASAKGSRTGPNFALDPKSPCARAHLAYAYINCLLKGSIIRFAASSENELSAQTRRVLDFNGMLTAKKQLHFARGKNPIRHVIYVIKENRSYDQVFGDMAEANGDPSLVLFGEDVTPNHHKLAREFGILDNFFASGEVSGDGHNWSTSAIGSDYLEKTIQTAYRDERTYDYEGENTNRIPLEDGLPDVNEPGTGYIWSNVARHKLTYRHYGEFVATQWCASKNQPRELLQFPAGKCSRGSVNKGETLPLPWNVKSAFPWPVPVLVRNIATKPELRGHFDPYYPDFNTWFPDQLRADEFLREFHGFVKARERGQGAELPNYVLLRLPNDHTTGEKALAPTPAAAVADNDLALGRVVDAVSHSAYWDDTAILVLEDDAQDGADHVDAHRTIALVISKYSPSSAEKPVVDSNFYTTVSMVRTLEELLDLPPMNNNDAQAPAINSLFSGNGRHRPFTADYQNLQNGLISKTNPANAPGAKASAEMDFTHADSANTAVLNAIIWRNRKGDMAPPEANK